ncbi:dolichyl-phosphate mannose synthase [Methanobacterium sp. MZ-A1]|jgi:glycosyltransferase involved in cell wall biosynthesis|uniref:glycosyltransferase family 2 protein n=1 Tax=Methanobacterium sp. MZ-A1 TaxID=1911685 RepID=UPI000C2D5E84|nr:glycosyltransferase family 2 protein [Methanobacterium sp. MZ-A1]AUB57953.1 dolichyl-phosphate mannose synthase [Methanobacterium sp. MZ-A1]MBW4256546.1 glycosyltransferase family 2 protein [Methanobacterium sp. YSL]
MRIITIIPAYNEETAILNVVKGVKKYSDVLVVDDGSTDKTAILAKNVGATVIKHWKNNGKGAAIKTGLKSAIEDDYDFMVLLDGDGQHDPQCIPFLLGGMDGVDLLIGSRFLNMTPQNMPLQRRLSNGITTWLIRFMTGYHITDSQCGFRVISKKAAPFFTGISYNDYVYESEVLCKASENDLVVGERPIQCIYGNEKSYVRARHVLHYLMFTLRLLVRKLLRRI